MIKLGLFGTDDIHRRVIEKALLPEIEVVFSERPTVDYPRLLEKGVDAILIDASVLGIEMDEATLDVMGIMTVPAITNDERIDGANGLKKRIWKNHMMRALERALDIRLERHESGYQVITNDDGETLAVWVIAASAGGPLALEEFLLNVAPGIPAAFILVQHNDPDFVEAYTEMIAGYAETLNTVVAETGHRLRQGDLLIVPPRVSVDINTNGQVELLPYKTAPRYWPSADSVIRLIGERFGPSAAAAVFSGMGNDAAEGVKILKKHGGTVLVQEPSTAIQPSMPQAAIEAVSADRVAPPADLAHAVSMYRCP